MYKSTLAVAALLSVASAQSTVSLYLPGFDPQSIDASVVGSGSSMTTYALACPSGTDSTECGIPPGFTITQGSSSLHFSYSADDGAGETETIDVGCKITSSKTAACTFSQAGQFGSSKIASSDATTVTDFDNQLQAVTITAGAIASGANTAASTTATGSSTSKGSSAGSGSSTGSSSGSPSKASSSLGSGTVAPASTAGTSSSSTGGMPMITGNPWAVGGAAVAIAYAAM